MTFLLRRKIGIPRFQITARSYDKDNMLFVLKPGWTDKRKWTEKIDVLIKGMKDYAAKMPHQISSGEQQRVAIARALLNDP
jgi:cell division transport system ATP-binding protein